MDIKQLREMGVNNSDAEKIAAEFDVLRADIKIANGTISEMQSLLDDYADEHPKLIDEVKSLRAELEARGSAEQDGWRELIANLASDLESEINSRYGSDIHPAMARKYDVDMEIVLRARAVLSAAPTPPSTEQPDSAAREHHVLQLTELMRGLELSPTLSTLHPSKLYLIGKAIAEQAKDAAIKPQHITEQDAREIITAYVLWRGTEYSQVMADKFSAAFFTCEKGLDLLAKLNENREPDYKALCSELANTAKEFMDYVNETVHMHDTKKLSALYEAIAKYEGGK